MAVPASAVLGTAHSFSLLLVGVVALTNTPELNAAQSLLRGAEPGL